MTRKMNIKDLPKQQTLGSGPNTRQEELEARFREFHAKYPGIFKQFMHYALDMRKVSNRYSAYGIMHMVRYLSFTQPSLITSISISNDLVPYYARLAMETDPRLAGFFATRRLTTEDKRPRGEWA